MNAKVCKYSNILVAIDFSSHSAAALKQAAWLARKVGAKLVLAHSLPDVRKAILDVPYEGRTDLLYGDGELFQKQLRHDADEKLQSIAADVAVYDVKIQHETLLGEPYIELIHAVQAEGYDLVVAGTRGLSPWKEFVIGGTAKRLVRKCPSSVLIVKQEHTAPPKVVLAATDLSQVSVKAVMHALSIAEHADAELHLLHVIDSLHLTDEVIRKSPKAHRVRSEIDEETKARLRSLVQCAEQQPKEIQVHVSWGTPWKEVYRMAELLHADLIAMGTVGRGGFKGLLLGNTAEKVLGACNCSVLTVKPDDFVSPISPAFWRLHPATEEQEPSKSFDAEGSFARTEPTAGSKS